MTMLICTVDTVNFHTCYSIQEADNDDTSVHTYETEDRPDIHAKVSEPELVDCNVNSTT